jgi:hypothetical protein
LFRIAADLVIIGGGAAAREAAAILPQAQVLASPAETVWHAQDRTLWIETAEGIGTLTFSRLLLCTNEPLLLLSLGCRFDAGRPVVDQHGETSQAGVFAAGEVLGATDGQSAIAASDDQSAIAASDGRPAIAASDGRSAIAAWVGPSAVAQARIAARVLAGLPPEGRITVAPAAAAPAPCERLDPVEIAALLEQPPGTERNRAVLAQAALLGAVLPARPVGFAVLAAAAGPVTPRPAQSDAGLLA